MGITWKKTRSRFQAKILIISLGTHLFLKRKRIVFAEPQLRLELLDLARHLLGAADVAGLEVRLAVKVLRGGDAAGVVGAEELGLRVGLGGRLLDLDLGHAQERLQRVLVALGALLVLLGEVLRPRARDELHVVGAEHLGLVAADRLALVAAPAPEAAAGALEVDLVRVDEGEDERRGEARRDLLLGLHVRVQLVGGDDLHLLAVDGPTT